MIRRYCILFSTFILTSHFGSTYADETSDAAALMDRAHKARANWNGFPGFSADLAVFDGDSRGRGTLTVSGSGEVSIELTQSMPWAESKLKSLAAHRMGDPDRDYNVSFADEVKNNPLGRLIKINDDSLMGSKYRIQNDVIREVHRTMGDTRFTITVISVSRNKQEKYLPAVYTVSYWDAKTGALKSTSVVRDVWEQVGKWDLPKRLLTVESAGDGARRVKDIRLKNHRLLIAEPGDK